MNSQQGKKEVVLISHWFGHVPFFMACIVPIFQRKGYTLYHLTDKPDEAKNFLQESIGEEISLIHHIQIEKSDLGDYKKGDDTKLLEVKRHWKGVEISLQRLFSRLGYSVPIFHTWVDLYSHPLLPRKVIEEAMPVPWCGLFIHPFEIRVYKTWKRKAFEAVQNLMLHKKWRPNHMKAFNSRFARKIYFYDENIIPLLARYFRNEIGISSFPDCALTNSENSKDEFSNLDFISVPGKLVLCLTGFLSRRKGFLTLTRLAKLFEGNWLFLFAGEVDWESFTAIERAEIQDFIDNPPINSFIIDKKLDNVEFNAVIAVSDVIYLAYENFFHSSNIQVIAASNGKPIITGPEYLIAERTKQFGLGWCLSSLTENGVHELLLTLNQEKVNNIKREAKFEEFIQSHSQDILEQKIDEVTELISRE